MLTKVCVVESF